MFQSLEMLRLIKHILLPVDPSVPEDCSQYELRPNWQGHPLCQYPVLSQACLSWDSVAWSAVPKACAHMGCGVARGRWAKQPPSLLLWVAQGSCELRPPAPALQLLLPTAQPQLPGWWAPSSVLLALVGRAAKGLSPALGIASCPAHPCS